MEGRRRRGLTPLSGELRTPEWAPPEPVAQPRPERKRKPKPAPTTRAGAVLYALRSFALLTLGLAGATALLALLVVWLTGSSPQDTFPRAFYFAGVATAAFGFLGGLGPAVRGPGRAPVGEITMNRSFSFGAVAAVLIGIGVVLEIFL